MEFVAPLLPGSSQKQKNTKNKRKEQNGILTLEYPVFLAQPKNKRRAVCCNFNLYRQQQPGDYIKIKLALADDAINFRIEMAIELMDIDITAWLLEQGKIFIQDMLKQIVRAK